MLNKFFFFCITIFIIILQLIYTQHSLNQIRYEELAESIRAPFWFYYGFMYDGLSGSMTWYTLLNLFYGIFGFHLFLAKYVKLLIFFLGIVTLATLLKRYLGIKRAILPLLAIGLSPTLLYFNILENTYALDLYFFLFCLYFLYKIDFRKYKQAVVFQILTWIFAMLGALIYPSFLFFLPVIIILYIRVKKKKKVLGTKLIKNILLSTLAFLTPLVLTILYIKNKQFLLNDPNVNRGLFRGGGALKFDFNLFLTNLDFLKTNLFEVGYGYYYEILYPDFSHLFPMVSLVVVLGIIIKILLNLKKQEKLSRKLSLPIFLSLGVLILNIILINFSDVLTPGLRRYIPALAAIYALYVISWYFISNKKNFWKGKFGWIVTFIFLLIPLHHLLIYPGNLAYLKQPSHYAYYPDAIALNRVGSPPKALKELVDRVQKEDLNLVCVDKLERPVKCRYDGVYSAVAGFCLWNKITCHSINGYDFKQKKFIPLHIDLWNNLYFGYR